MNNVVLKKLNRALALFVVAGAMVSSASAESLLAFVTRANNAEAATSGVLVPLGNLGATSLAFTTSAANKVVKITYNAECGVLGPVQSWLSVTVLVDGSEANPASSTSFALCTASSTSTYSWTGAVRQSVYKVAAAGAHKVEIRVNLNNGATEWWLGDTSLTVEQQ
jgi:hypothetical protein